MAAQGDTCLFSALQTSGLNSCYVWIKRTGSGSLAAPTRSVTLNCVPCQLQIRRAAWRGHGPDSSFSVTRCLSFPPLLGPRFLQDIPFQRHLRDAQQSRGRQNDVRKTRARATAAHFLNTPIKHEACLVRLLWHPLSKSQPCLAEAEKQMSWVSLPLLDRAVKTHWWRTLKTMQMELRSYLRFSLFLCQEPVSRWETIKRSSDICSSPINKYISATKGSESVRVEYIMLI